MATSIHGVSRREFLKLASAAAVASTLPGMIGCRSAPAQNRIPIGMQLYTVREQLAEDVEGTIARLAQMGYEGVEFADYFDLSAAQWRRILDDNGLRCCGTHIMMDTLQGDELPRTIEFNQTLGNQYLIVRWLNEEQRNSRDAILRTADELNEIAENLAPHGMRTGYHNHDYIFQEADGEYFWDILGDNTRDDVILQLDTGNASEVAGVDPVELIQRHPGRTATMHVKPFSHDNPDAFIGDDDLNWPRIFDLAEQVGGIEWYILEYEKPAHPPLHAMEQMLERMRQFRSA